MWVELLIHALSFLKVVNNVLVLELEQLVSVFPRLVLTQLPVLAQPTVLHIQVIVLLMELIV